MWKDHDIIGYVVFSLTKMDLKIVKLGEMKERERERDRGTSFWRRVRKDRDNRFELFYVGDEIGQLTEG